MTNEQLYNKLFPESEEPLEHIPEDGGFCSIFRKIVVVGDSLSSGEFETVIPGKNTYYTELYEYSWGQFLARMCGCEVQNFSKGGITARDYCQFLADERNYWDPAKKAQAYIIALGVNDLQNCHHPLGSVADIHVDDYTKNPDTYAGWIGRIVLRYKEIAPDAKFFFVTMPVDRKPENTEINKLQAKLMYELTEVFSNSYVIDLLKYSPKNDMPFRDIFYMHGHFTPCGYYLYAKLIAAYIDFIIRHNMKDFNRAGLINTELSDTLYQKMLAEAEAEKKD